MTAPNSRVPLIPSQALSEWGDLREQAQFYDPNGMDMDQSYVPGWSEQRREHDLKRAAYLKGQASAAEVPVLPVNLRWARNQTREGKPDNAKPFVHGRKGYRPVTSEDIGKEWLKELPLAAQTNADGTIRNGDTILMVCDRESAARNELRKRAETQARLDGSVNAFMQNLQASGTAVRGAEPTIEKLTPKQ